MKVSELERNLEKARKRLTAAIAALAPVHKGGEMEEYNAAEAATLTLERELAAAKGEQYAVPFDFPVKWNTGAPMPHLFSSDTKTFLTFYVNEPDPNWDGTYVNIVSPGDGVEYLLALVEVEGCTSAKLGSPNDEVLNGHPLYGRGLESYTAQVVENSLWLAELEAINKVHHFYNPERWRNRKHFVLWFHDNTFECVATGFKVEVHRESMAALLNRVCERMLL